MAETTIRTKRGKVPAIPATFDMGSAVRNILRVWDSVATEEHREHGARWYSCAYDECMRIAIATGLRPVVVVGVMAALSPANRWDRNVTDCAALCGAFVTGGLPAAQLVKVCTYGPNKTKALLILAMDTAPGSGWEERANDIAGIVYGSAGRKLRSFFHCILAAGDTTDSCIDGHAWGIAHADRKSMNAVPSLSASRYAALQVAYTRAARERGTSACTMQAATWVAWRDHHNV